ncbi:MAG: 1-acyl-sn-glycerol-3-phosphate acyltransferase [Rickettsiales bacterium]|jgi:1-acyl-sn-glycerol-3-phosphate acyltransferase|nr:1-acyl-sn-glycerol-3-phosphate acyltransferase [Rickettsiales bacterium]
MFKTILFKTALALWFIGWAPLLLIGLVSFGLNRRFVLWDAAGVLWLARIIVGIRCELRGRFEPGAIIASKHMSILEIAVLELNNPNSFFIIKRELLWIPIYGWAFWRMGFIGVNRKRGATNMKILADRAAEKMAQGRTLVIFPEGTRALPGQGVRLKRGLLFIAERTRRPIQPAGTDAGLYWPKRGRMRGGTALVWLEPPLPFDAPPETIAAEIARHSA